MLNRPATVLVVFAAACGSSGTDTTIAPPPPVAVASVEVTVTAADITIGKTEQATATPRDATHGVITGQAVSWSSSAPQFATIDGNGTITPIAIGPATISAAVNGTIGSVQVNIGTPGTNYLIVALDASTIRVGASTMAHATGYDRDGHIITCKATWLSSLAGVARVSAGGLVTGLSPGATAIWADCGMNKPASLTVVP